MSTKFKPYRIQRLYGFSLAEVTICLGLIAVALVTVLGLLPTGLDTSRKAMDHTAVAAVLEDVYNRVMGTKLVSDPLSGDQDIDFNPASEDEIDPAYYDSNGIYIDPALGQDELERRRVYRVEAFTWAYKTRPEHTSQLRSLTLALSWPIHPKTGEAKEKGRDRVLFTFGVTPLTGPDWSEIDPDYLPRIEY